MRPRRVTLSDSIRAALEGEILSGALGPGTTLDERVLIERFGVSRTPVREALLQLVSSGHLESVPRKGMVVTSLSVPDFVASLEVLIDLERLAATLATRRMTMAERQHLEAVTATAREAADRGDPVAYMQAYRAVHDAIHAGCGNPVLVGEIRVLRARTRHPSTAIFQMPGRIAASVREHDELVNAIVSGDESAAGRLMEHHLSLGGTVFVDSVARLSAPLADVPSSERSRASLTVPVGTGDGSAPAQPER